MFTNAVLVPQGHPGQSLEGQLPCESKQKGISGTERFGRVQVLSYPTGIKRLSAVIASISGSSKEAQDKEQDRSRGHCDQKSVGRL